MKSHWLANLLILEFNQDIIRTELRSRSTRETVARILDVFFATVFYMNLPIEYEVETEDPQMINIWAFVSTMHHFPFANVLHYPTDETITPDFKKKYYLLYQDPRRSSEGITGQFSEPQRHQLHLWRLLRYTRVSENQSFFVWRILNETDAHHIALIENFIPFLGGDFCDILFAHMRLNTILALTEKMLIVAQFRNGIERRCLEILVRYYDDIKIDLLDEEKKRTNDSRFDLLRQMLQDS